MPERVLVTGATGFVAGHLIEFLLTHTDAHVSATRRRRSDARPTEDNGRVQWVEMDVNDAHNVFSTIRDIRPTHIFHLAAQSFVPTSWRSPAETLLINAVGTIHMLEAVRALDLDAKIQIAGSSEEYGDVRTDELPITEKNPLRPLSPYGVSKVSADLSGRQYHRSFGLHVIVTRAFNHTGPGRGDVFVESNFSRQIAAIELGTQEAVMRVGNLDAVRDFSDVRDIVRGYWLALERGTPGEVYNICSGEALTIQEVLDTLLSLSAAKDIRVARDPERVRPSDVPVLIGACSKFRQATGWRPEIPRDRTWRDLLVYWRNRMKIERMANATS